MNKTRPLAAVALLTFATITPLAFAQSTPAAQAARQQQLQAAQAAARARAAAAAAAANPAPTVAPPPTPTVTATAAPTATTPPKPTASATVTPPKPTATAAASAAPATSGSAAPVAAAVQLDAATALDIEALRKNRPERRHAEFVDLQTRWGNLLSDPRAADELKLHAQRFAYLQRIRALGAKDPAFVKSVDALITKEDSRSSDALNALRSGALPTAAAVAPAAGAAK